MRVLGALIVTAILAGTAAAAGPWPGLAESVWAPSGIVYTAARAGGFTTVKAVRGGTEVASTRFAGTFGIPAVTTNGEAGGLSPSGRLLVLAQPPNYQGLRRESRFVVLTAPLLARTATIVLPGEFGYDAVSPNGRYLYVIQHTVSSDLVRYAVRAYDLRARRLLPGAIVDKREPNEAMRGMPVARAASPRGDWVYTLYTRDPETRTMFVHALNASGRYAHCIDLPVWRNNDLFDATLALGGHTLLVRDKSGETVARIDTRTLKVR